MQQTNLPECRHRGDAVTQIAPGSGAASERVECFMPLVRGREEVALVSPHQCQKACGFSDAVWQAAGEYYQPPSINHTPYQDFVDRWTVCDACRYRSGNYCSRAGGTCPLTQKLVRPSFFCPEGNFQAVESCPL